MIHDTKPPLDEALLVHFGVKGMHWGVRNEETSKGTKLRRTSAEKKALAKKVAIGVGILTVAVGATYLAHNKGLLNFPVSSIKPPSANTQKLVKKVQEQTDIIHATRFKNKGFQFVKKGGLHDPLSEYESVFGHNQHEVGIKRLADGRVAATFHDFSGRKDFAGRVIPHQVLIPKLLAAGIETIDDVQQKIWPLLKDAYDERYDK